MDRSLKRCSSIALVGLIAMTVAANAASADSAGKPAADLQSRIGHYEQEITDLTDTAHGIAADYAAGNDVTDRTDALVETWEKVDFHETLEDNAMPLYPPIWVALGQLSDAVGQKDNQIRVNASRQRLSAALHQGLGALKLMAARSNSDSRNDAPQQAASSGGDRPAVVVIRDNLQQVLAYYRDDDKQAAQTLIQETYMQRFEGIEGALIEQDADLVTGLEKDFNATLPQLIENGASAGEVETHIDAMDAKLERAQTLLGKASQDKSSVF